MSECSVRADSRPSVSICVGLVFAVCPASLALSRILSAAFQPLEHVESAAEPISKTNHSEKKNEKRNKSKQMTKFKRRHREGLFS